MYIIAFILSATSVASVDYTYRMVLTSNKWRALTVFASRLLQGWITSMLCALGACTMYVAFGGTMVHGFGALWMHTWLVIMSYLSVISMIVVCCKYVCVCWVVTSFVVVTSYVVVTSNILICKVLIGPLGTLLFPILLILQISSNNGATSMDLQPLFYKIGMALPMYHAINGGRIIVFGGNGQQIGTNVGVLAMYVAACVSIRFLHLLYQQGYFKIKKTSK